MPMTETTDNPLNDVKRISTREARNQFSDLIGQVHYTGEPVIIERSGKPMVIMLSVEMYEQLLTNQSSQNVSEQVGQSIDEPLSGAFPELAAITDDDLTWAKQLWNQSVEKQLRIIDGLDP